MNFFSTTRQGWWPFLVIGLIMLTLWGSLFFNSPQGVQPLELESQEQTAYGELLPNFLAPVIRKEVHKETDAEEENVAVKVSMPRLNLFNAWR